MKNEKGHSVGTERGSGVAGRINSTKAGQQEETIRKIMVYWFTMRKAVSPHPVAFGNGGSQWIPYVKE